MGKGKKGKGKGNGKKRHDEMSKDELLMEFFRIFTSDKLTPEQRREIYDYAMKLLTERDTPDNSDSDS